MLLYLEHPKLARRSCDDCTLHVYDDKGDRVMWRGAPMKRHANNRPPCRQRANGCPKGTPEQSKALSARNWLAYQHYLECKATGNFPDDPIVRRNAAIIRAVEDAYGRGYQLKTMLLGLAK